MTRQTKDEIRHLMQRALDDVLERCAVDDYGRVMAEVTFRYTRHVQSAAGHHIDHGSTIKLDIALVPPIHRAKETV